MELSKTIQVFALIAIAFLYEMSSAFPRSLEERVLQDLAPNTTLRYNYTGYLRHLELTDRTDLIIELTPVYQWDIKPEEIEVWDKPLTDLFGEQALGKVLKLDERTQLYKLPPADHDVTEEDRLKMMWLDKSYHNYCAERIGKVSLPYTAQTGVRVICTDDFYKDRCCGYVDKCLCITATIGCTCISDEDQERRMKMFNEAVELGKGIKEAAEEVAAKVAAKIATSAG